MPLGYGSQYVGVRLTSEEIATELYRTPSKSFGLTGFLRILLTIAEIGIAFIPGVDVIGETLFGLGAGIGNEILDVQEGNANVASSILNIGSAFVGGAFSGAKNLASVGNYEYDLAKAISSSVEEGAPIQNLYETINSVRQGGILASIDRGASGVFSSGNITQVIADEVGIAPSRLGAFLPKIQETIAPSIGDAALRTTDNILREGIDDERFEAFLNKSGLSASLAEDLKDILRMARTLDEQRSMLIGFIRNLGARDAVTFYRNVTGEIEQVFLNEAWQLPYAKQFAKEYDYIIDSTRWTKEGAYSKVIQQRELLQGETYMDEVKRELTRQDKPFMKRLVDWFGSAKFNDKVVQRGQAILDPNDLGRAGIEHLYKEMKTLIGTYFRKTEKMIAGADKIEDAFVKSGGKLVDSGWHLGYKVIKDLGLGKQLIMIQFKSEETNGKRPVFVLANDLELERYIASPGHTYLRLWSLSRGGRSLGLGKIFGASNVFKVGKQASSVLGFMPVQALRNILSLVSNVVENTADVANGTYFKTYQKKFIGSLTRSAVSRTFRLAGKVVAGGIATQAFGRSIGNFVGREAQRVGTIVFAKGIQNVNAGKAFFSGTQTRLINGALTSVRGNLLRNLRYSKPNSAIVNSLSARRKMYQVKRIQNAFVPGRPWKGIKL